MKSLSLPGISRLGWHALLLIIITCLAFWLRFANLGSIALYNDEYFQFETAAGLVETGEYRQYNFYTGQTEEEYTRAKPYTWQIAQSFKIFGYTESAARLPAVLWGTILVPLIVISVWRLMHNPWVAYGAGVLIAFDNFFVEMSRFTRMYSMVFVLTVLIISLTHAAFIATSKKRQMILGALAGALLLFSIFIFKELAMALVVGIAIYIALRAVLYLWKKNPEDNTMAWLFVMGSALAIFGTIIHLLGWHFIPIDAFIYRSVPHFSYLWDVFSELHIPMFGAFFLVFGILGIKSIRSYEGFISVVALSLLAYFIYFSHRWEAKRYIGFLLPFLYILITLGIVRSFRLLGSLLKVSGPSKAIIGIAGFIIVGPWLSFPGIQTDYMFIQPAYADKTHADLHRADVKTAYQYVADHYSPGENVFIQGPRYFYWPNNTIPITELGEYKSLEFDDFLALIRASDQGGWVVYNATKTRHLEKRIRQFSSNKFDYKYELDDTLVFVFHFTPEDVKRITPETL